MFSFLSWAAKSKQGIDSLCFRLTLVSFVKDTYPVINEVHKNLTFNKDIILIYLMSRCFFPFAARHIFGHRNAQNTKKPHFLMCTSLTFLSREIKVTVNRKVMKKCIRMKTGQIKSLDQSN